MRNLTVAGLVLVATAAFFGPALGQTGSVSIAVVWSGQELEAFEATIAKFEQDTGIDVTIEPVGRDLPTVLITRVQAGNPPDVAALPNPGQMKELVAQGVLVPLDNYIKLDQQPKGFLDLTTVDGHVYGIFLDADVKSLVWYNPKAFAAQGYEVPETWDELIALSDKIVADGGVPWSIGLESGAASGWPGTDWLEDLMLRICGPEIYDLWVNHEISWLNPCVQAVWNAFGEIALNEDYVYGGIPGELSTNFGDAANPLFTDPPGAYMHRQATFMQSFIQDANPDLVPGEDYDVFLFPPMGPGLPTPILGSGDLVGVFNDAPESQALIEYLSSAEAQEIFCSRLGKLAVNNTIDPNIYDNPITRKAYGFLKEAEIFRFDASDLMPASVGSGAFWTELMSFVNGKPLDQVLNRIENVAQEAYK
ncbi:MAG: ABC transporter substrate-binding protein [Candidatus Bipolaricaulaceae bacterium]